VKLGAKYRTQLHSNSCRLLAMKRASLSLAIGLGVLAFGAQAFALGTATSPVNAQIIERVGIDVVSAMVLPNVGVTAVGAGGLSSSGGLSSGGVSSGGGASGAPATPGGNATLTIHGQVGGAVSMSVPESFTVVRTGGTESLTVNTSTNSQFGLGGDGVMLGGSATNGNTMSVNVGGELALASANSLVPGPYEGLLVVVVQYN
jgi:hypothetical protein